MGDLEDNLESLFLLEVLVDNVQFDKPPKEENLRETCVGFQFLNYPPLIICEEDFVYMADDEFDKQNIQFKSGKSILFALPSLQEGNPNLGSIHVWVTRRVDRSDKTVLMGSTNINLTGSFENLLQASAKHLQTSPLSKFIRDVYPFHSKEDGTRAGTISAFLRVSCFGKLIVTQFEVKGKEKFSFTGMDTDKVSGGTVRFDPNTKAGGNDSKISVQGGTVPTETAIGGPGIAAGMYPGMGGSAIGPGMTPGMYPGMGAPGMTLGTGGIGIGHAITPGMYAGMGGSAMGPGMNPGMYSGMGGPGMYPGMGGPAMGPGMTSGMYPGMYCPPMGPSMTPEMYPGMGGPAMGPGITPGMYPAVGPESCPGMGMQLAAGQGMFGPGQMTVQPNMTWGSKRVHQKPGTLPCGEPKCPIGACGGFPCQHSPPCGNINCTAALLAMGFPVGGAPRPIGSIMCPTDRLTNVTPDEITAALPKAEAEPKTTSGKKGKGGKKGKK